MRTRGKIWNPGAATFQRVCFPGYGGSQPERSHPMPVEHSARPVETADQSGAYQVTRGKVDRVRTPEGDRYVLSSHDLMNSEPEHHQHHATHEPLFFSNAPKPQASAAAYHAVSQEIEPVPTNYATPVGYSVNTPDSVSGHSASGSQGHSPDTPLTQQDLRTMMQREIAELREQLTATLVQSVNSLSTGHQQTSVSDELPAPASESAQPCETQQQANKQTGRVQVAEIDSESVSSYEQRAVEAKKALFFYAKSPVPSGAVTNYQLPDNPNHGLKTLESRLCTSLPGEQMVVCDPKVQSANSEDAKVLPVEPEDKVTEQETHLEATVWESLSPGLVPLIQKTCREMIQKEIQVLREQLTGVIQDSLKSLTVSHENLKTVPEKRDDTLAAINNSLKKKVDRIKSAAMDRQMLNSDTPLTSKETPVAQKTPANVSCLGCFSEAGAVAYRKLRKNPKKVVSLQQREVQPASRRKVTDAQKNIKGLRDQLNAVVQSGSQFFTTGNEKHEAVASRSTWSQSQVAQEKFEGNLNNEIRNVSQKSHTAIAKYTNLNKQSESGSNNTQSDDLKRVWRWGGSSPRVTPDSFSKAKPTL